MKIKGLISEDFVNYKTPTMTILFPHCSFKCGVESCQNHPIVHEKDIEISIDDIISKYLNNPITEAVVMQGLEPFDSWDHLIQFVECFRQVSNDDVVIYTGYNKSEIIDRLIILSQYTNIVVKYGRYIPNQQKHYDKVLGVHLASDNQYAERIS